MRTLGNARGLIALPILMFLAFAGAAVYATSQKPKPAAARAVPYTAILAEQAADKTWRVVAVTPASTEKRAVAWCRRKAASLHGVCVRAAETRESPGRKPYRLFLARADKLPAVADAANKGKPLNLALLGGPEGNPEAR